MQDVPIWTHTGIAGLLCVEVRALGYGFRLRVQLLRFDAAGHGQLEP